MTNVYAKLPTQLSPQWVIGSTYNTWHFWCDFLLPLGHVFLSKNRTDIFTFRTECSIFYEPILPDGNVYPVSAYSAGKNPIRARVWY